MADGTLKKFSEFWSGVNSAPEETPQLFQHRITHTPGIVAQPTTPGANVGGEYRAENPANLIPQDSSSALLKLRNEWAARAKQNPREGYLTMAPEQQMNSNAINHEAAHSLYNQAIPYASPQDQHLSQFASQSGVYMPTPQVAGYDQNSGREAGAYAVGHFAGQESDPQATQSFMQEIVKSAQSPQEKKAAEQLFNFYIRQNGRQ